MKDNLKFVAEEEITNDKVLDTADKEVKFVSADEATSKNKDQYTRPNFGGLVPYESENIGQDPTKFDFQLKVDADNEEIRARRQGLIGLYGKASLQTTAVAIGGIIEGAGYITDLFVNLPQLVSGEEVQFNNILTKIGSGIQDYVSEELAPIYQTRRAQEGGIKALSDATYLSGNMPTIASSFAIMAPTYAATRIASIAGRALKASRAGRKAGETVAEGLSPAIRQTLNSRRAQGITNHLGNTVLSRHTYNSLEANDTFQQTYQNRIQAGDDEQTAKKKAGQAAAYVYRSGYINIWKDALQWKVILGTKYSSAKGSKPWFTKSGSAASSIADKRRLVELGKKFPGGRIPQRAIMQAGIGGKKGKEALKALGKMGLAEGVEEINIQHQKQLAMDYVDLINEADSAEPLTGWGDIYGDMIPGYLSSLGDFVYDEDTIISPRAFDAAFWAFMSGAAMGGLMKAGQSFADKKFGSIASNMAKQKAELDYFKAQTNTYQKALAEGNETLADQIYDDIIFSMGIKGFSEGNTHVDGALSEARFEDLLKSLEGIIQADDSTLDNSGVPSDPEMRQMYERMYADLGMIESLFEKNFATKAGFGDSYDRKLATAQTYYEFLKNRWGERISDFNSRKAEIDSKIDSSIFEEGYKAIADNRVKQEGLKQTKALVEMRLSDIKKHKPTTKGEVNSKARNQAELSKQLDNINDILKELQTEAKEIKKGVEKSEQQESIVDEFVDNQVELVQLESDISQYETAIENIIEKQKELSTKDGQKAYIDRIKKSQKEALNNERIAKIELAQTLESLNEIDLEGTSAETKRIFNDRKNVLKRRDQEVDNINKPKIDQSHINDIVQKIPHFENVEQLNEFKDQIDQQEELHGNTQKAIKNYATKIFEASQRGQQIELSKQEARDLRKKLIKEDKQKHVNKLESFSEPKEGLKYIEESGLSAEEKAELKNFYKKSLITKYDKLDSKELEIFKEAKEADDVRKGKKPPVKPNELEFNPEDASDVVQPQSEDPRPKPPTEETKDTIDPNDLQITQEDSQALLDDIFEEETSEETQKKVTDKEVISTENFAIFTEDGKISKSEGRELFRLNKTSETEGYIEFIEGSLYQGVAANMPDSFIKPLFMELNYDRSSNKIFNVTPTKVRKEGNKWVIVKRGEISYGRRMESEKTDPDVKEKSRIKDKENKIELGNNKVFTLAKVQYSFQQGERKLQFKVENGKLSIKRNKIVLDNEDVQFSSVANPNLVEGSEVRLELQQNEFSKNNNGDDVHPVVIIDVSTGEKIGLLRTSQAGNNPELRKIVTGALKDGKQVKATVINKIDSNSNLNNIIIDGKPYFRSVKTMENRWVEKENNTWVKEKSPVILTTSEGIQEQRLLTINTEYFNFLTDNVKEKINRSIESTNLQSKTDFKFDGHVWAILPTPTGEYRAVKLLTQKLDKKAVNEAYKAIINNNKEKASEIVFTDSSLINDTSKELYLEVSRAPITPKPGQKSVDLNIIRYYDENVGQIIQLSKTASDESFTIKKVKEDADITEGISKEDVEIFEGSLNYTDGLKKLLANKRYNVSRERVGQMDVSYTSPTTGSEYANYYQYLTSPKEIESVSSDFQGDNSAKSIIATDIYNDNGSFTSNVGVQIEINDIETSKQQKEVQKEELISQKDTQVEETTDTPTPKRPKRERKTQADIKLEKAYSESSELQKKYVSLEDFKDRYKYDEAPNIDLFIESEIERIKNNC